MCRRLVQPGFIISDPTAVTQTGSGSRHILRSDEQVTMGDVVQWCSASWDCEGITIAHHTGTTPHDRLPLSACYCCHVDVHTSRAQFSLTKWAPPLDVSADAARAAESNAGGLTEAGAAGAGRVRIDRTLLPPLLETRGYLSGGRELHSAFMTVEEATLWCSEQQECHGFSCQMPPEGQQSSVLYMRFAGEKNELVHHPEWLTWNFWHRSIVDENGFIKEEL